MKKSIMILNTVFQSTIKDKDNQPIQYRCVFEDGQIVALHDLKDLNNCTIEILSKYEFYSKIRNLELFSIPDPEKSFKNQQFLLSVSEKVIKEAESDLQLVESVLKNDIYMFLDSKKRTKYIKEIAQLNNINPQTLKRKISRYLSRGMDVYSLYKRYVTKLTQSERKNYRERPGRKTEHRVPNIEYKPIFQKYYELYYLNSNRSIKSVYDLIIAFEFTDNNSIIHPIETRPSYSDFLAFVNKQSPTKKIISKSSEIFYENNYAPVMGSSEQNTLGPYDQVQIDNTVLDIYLVSEFDRTKSVGRPLLTLIKDERTRMILGVNISLENCSYETAALQAILNMVEDKVEYCKKYGLEISFEQWPVKRYLPHTLLADKGELYSNYANALPKYAGIEIRNTSTGRARQKPVIERTFRTINNYIKEHFANRGAVLNIMPDRLTDDYRKQAKMTLNEFTKEILSFIIFLNHKKIDKYKPSPEEVAYQIQPIPIALFNHLMKYRFGSLACSDINTLKVQLMPREKRVLNKEGIRFKNLVYYPSTLEVRQWMSDIIYKNRSNKVQVEFLYSNRDPSMIYVIDGTELIPFVLDNKQKQFATITFDEIDILFNHYYKTRKEWEESSKQLKVDLDIQRESRQKEIDEIALDSVSIKDIRKNRKEEISKKMKPIFEDPVNIEKITIKERKTNNLKELKLLDYFRTQGEYDDF